MDDFAPFESPKLLLDGAKTSITNFKPACETFIESCTYDIVYNKDPNTEQRIVKLRFHHRLPPKLRYAASGIVNDLRHALDQAACDGAIALGRQDARGVYFPFGKTAKNLDDEVAAKCKKVHPMLVTFIRAFGSHYGGDDLLYSLSSIAGPNKHQRVLRMSLDSQGAVFGLSGQPWGMTTSGNDQIGINKWNELRNELEFCRFGKAATGNIDVRPVLKVVLGAGEPPLSDPAPTVLDALASKVESIVLGMEAEVSRIRGLNAPSTSGPL
jgi:hypothetical protein